MRAQRKFFWITLILSIFCIGAMFPLYLFLSDEKNINIILKVILSGLSTGLFVSTIMSFVAHRNEKDKYMKKLYEKASNTYYYFQDLFNVIDHTLNDFNNKK